MPRVARLDTPGLLHYVMIRGTEIFEPFYSTKPTTGTGLGLGVVKRLVHLYGRSIDVESKVGDGTKFTATLRT
ncbi:MAG: ATP-binding protein [Thermodesulfobacteriota bacterium]